MERSGDRDRDRVLNSAHMDGMGGGGDGSGGISGILSAVIHPDFSTMQSGGRQPGQEDRLDKLAES